MTISSDDLHAVCWNGLLDSGADRNPTPIGANFSFGDANKIVDNASKHAYNGGMKYLVQYDLEGSWITIASRANFAAACSKARSEGRAMRWAHHTSVIRQGDPEILRRLAEDNFRLKEAA
jgi:hypothetical protein